MIYAERRRISYFNTPDTIFSFSHSFAREVYIWLLCSTLRISRLFIPRLISAGGVYALVISTTAEVPYCLWLVVNNNDDGDFSIYSELTIGL